MRRWLPGVSLMFLALSMAGCAHQTGGYVGGGYFEECEPGYDCYGGYQYTCVFFEPPASPTRLEINLAHRHGHTRLVHPRDEGPGTAPQDHGSGSSSANVSAPSMPTVAREPVVVAAPSVDRGSPRVHN